MLAQRVLNRASFLQHYECHYREYRHIILMGISATLGSLGMNCWDVRSRGIRTTKRVRCSPLRRLSCGQGGACGFLTGSFLFGGVVSFEVLQSMILQISVSTMALSRAWHLYNSIGMFFSFFCPGKNVYNIINIQSSCNFTTCRCLLLSFASGCHVQESSKESPALRTHGAICDLSKLWGETLGAPR